MPQAVPSHDAVPWAPPAQTTEHPPQCAGSEKSVSQPSAATALQSPQPDTQLNPHVPALHAGVACGAVLHALVHVPQVPGEDRSVSQPSAACPLQSAHPDTQEKPHAPLEQVEVA